MIDHRVRFDFEITFANGGGIQGQEFRLDIDGDSIDDRELADLIVADLRLLMVEKVKIRNKRYVDEPHKRQPALTSTQTLVDLSHPIRDGMITYPGLPGPVITEHLSREESKAFYAEGVEFHIGRIEMVANTGTYIDAPFHRYESGTDIASLDLEDLVGAETVVVATTEHAIGDEVFADIETWGKVVLINTGWDANFGGDDYLGAHPYLTEAGARRLVSGGTKVVGIDSANIDDVSTGARPAHSLLLEAGIPIVEHLTNLGQLLGKERVETTVLPAPFVGVGTFPVRAVARIWN